MKIVAQRILDGLAAVLLVGAIVISGRLLLQSDQSAAVEDAAASVPPRFWELASRGHRLGPVDAPVVLVLFSSYSCGFCHKFHGTLTSLLRRYPDHFAVVVRHYNEPSRETGANMLALGAECAADQGRFADFHNAVFRMPQVVNYSDGWISVADSIGIGDLPAFRACVRSRRHGDRMLRDWRDGTSLGVAGTPTSFLNGIKVAGDAPMATLDSLITSFFPESGRYR